MKLFLISFCFWTTTLHSQTLVNVEGYPIAFTAEHEMQYVPSEDETIFSYDHEDHMVLFIVVPMEQESPEFLEDLKAGAREIARDMKFKNINDEGPVDGIPSSYYVSGIDVKKDVPIYVLAILDQEMGLAYEIIVYCYASEKINCETLVKSFQFLH